MRRPHTRNHTSLPAVHQVTLSFRNVHIEPTWDFFVIYDGNSTIDPQVSLTDSTIPAPIVSSGGNLLVVWISDNAGM